MRKGQTFHGNNQYETELFKKLSDAAGKYRISDLFRDFLRYSACYISNISESVHGPERGSQIKELLQKYEGHFDLHECLQLLVKAIQQNMEAGILRDTLGRIFECINLSNAATGQFFTPEHICRLMVKITMDEERLNDSGPITVTEPCIGSGRMLLAFANEVQDKGYNYCDKMVALAVDIDITCVFMSYIQLSLYGVPAVLVHGNSLMVEEWSRWYTPAYILQGRVFTHPMSIAEKMPEDDRKLQIMQMEDMATLLSEIEKVS